MKPLTTVEAAKRLGVSITRVHQLINGGRLPAQKVGRDLLINEEDLALVSDRKPGRPQGASGAAGGYSGPAAARKQQKRATKRG